MPPRFILVFENIDNTQRSLLHERIKELADSWWHEFRDVWIVEGGDSVSWWRDELSVFIPTRPSKMVALLYGEDKPRWASRHANTEWLVEH